MRGHAHGLPGGAHHILPHLPGGHSMLDPRRDMHGRIPPVYNPETNSEYSFKKYLEDIEVWVVMTDLPMFQQAVTMVSRLQGQAREVAALIPMTELVAGVTLQNGDYVDPVSNLLAHLAQRFGALPEEERNEAMMQVWTFSRRPHENVDSFLSRFAELRYRAAREGHYMMSVEGWAWMLLRQLPLGQTQVMHLLEPFNHVMPGDEMELSTLVARIR